MLTTFILSYLQYKNY